MSNLFRLNWRDVIGAVISSVLVAVLGYILKVGDIFVLDTNTLINVSAMAGAGSLLKALLTNKDGEFTSLVKIK